MLDVLPSFSLSCYCIQFWVFLVLGYFLVWPYCPYVVCIDLAVLAVLSLYVVRHGFHIDVMLATQLLINSTRFPLPWDIGTPRHWNPESMQRDIGTSGHWNPKCTGRRKGTVPITGNGHRPEERFSFSGTPLAVTGGLSAARFTAEPLMEVTTSWVVHVGCNCSSITLVLGISTFKFSSGVVSRSTGVERLVVVSPSS